MLGENVLNWQFFPINFYAYSIWPTPIHPSLVPRPHCEDGVWARDYIHPQSRKQLKTVTDITYLQYSQEEEKELTTPPDSGEAKHK